MVTLSSFAQTATVYMISCNTLNSIHIYSNQSYVKSKWKQTLSSQYILHFNVEILYIIYVQVMPKIWVNRELFLTHCKSM